MYNIFKLFIYFLILSSGNALSIDLMSPQMLGRTTCLSAEYDLSLCFLTGHMFYIYSGTHYFSCSSFWVAPPSLNAPGLLFPPFDASTPADERKMELVLDVVLQMGVVVVVVDGAGTKANNTQAIAGH